MRICGKPTSWACWGVGRGLAYGHRRHVNVGGRSPWLAKRAVGMGGTVGIDVVVRVDRQQRGGPLIPVYRRREHGVGMNVSV